MNSMERFVSLMQGKLPDRVPVICNLLDQGAKELNMSIEEYYSKGENVAEGQIKLINKFGYDIAWGTFYIGYLAKILGSKKMIFSETGPPNVGNLIIKDYKDIEKLIIPDNLEENQNIIELVKCIKILKTEFEGKRHILSAVLSSFSLPSILMGMENYFNLIYTGPKDLLNLLLEKSSLYCEKLTHILRKSGVDFIAYISSLSTVDIITLKQFKELALPWIKKDIQRIGTADVVFFNGGGRINPTIDTLIKETGLMVYYINPKDSVKEAKQIIDGRALLIGTINDIGLLSWSKEEIESEVKRIMEEGSLGGGFIFGTLVMPYLIPEEKIKIMLEAAYKYGRY
ncbi:MAG: hypothetical protein A2086_07245 [Spirochaetes bacterium GWD1_27_9]|nr:MAG: hypothetical protein A2Z98_11690 [Spirochaetes bacterium GWB1_27_13]OHD32196.1 MAG: hypothetical protein A2086_07245 [Spirochaetes bacterium GWD1_27_9]